MAEMLDDVRREEPAAAPAPNSWPVYLDKKQSAKYVSEKWFHVTPRVLEKWPLSTYRPGKRAFYAREELDQIAEGMIQSSLVRAA